MPVAAKLAPVEVAAAARIKDIKALHAKTAADW